MTSCAQTTPQQPNFPLWLFPLLLVSAIALADSQALLNLPTSYRTPLSDVVYDDHLSWRAEPTDDNPWRQNGDGLIPPSRLRTEVLPVHDYSVHQQSTFSGSMFQNENELAKPQTTILRLNF